MYFIFKNRFCGTEFKRGTLVSDESFNTQIAKEDNQKGEKTLFVDYGETDLEAVPSPLAIIERNGLNYIWKLKK